MAIEGYFWSEDGGPPAPYVEGYILFPRLRVVNAVHFLIDTGNDGISLHPRDIYNLGIDYRSLSATSLAASIGIGGSTRYYREPAFLRFLDSTGEDRFCQLEVRICESTADPAMREIPSLLGRDFLNRCDVRLNPSLNLVSLEPVNVEGEFVAPANPF